MEDVVDINPAVAPTPQPYLDKMQIAYAFAEFRPKLIARLRSYATGTRQNYVEDAVQRAFEDVWCVPEGTFETATSLWWWADKAAMGHLMRRSYATATGRGNWQEKLTLDTTWQENGNESNDLFAPMADISGSAIESPWPQKNETGTYVSHTSIAQGGYENAADKRARLIREREEKAKEAKRIGLKKPTVKKKRGEKCLVCGTTKNKKCVEHNHAVLPAKDARPMPFDIAEARKAGLRINRPVAKGRK